MTAEARPFDRILVANRGEIALRVIRACHELGIDAIAVYSDADRSAAHVRAADQAIRIGPAPAAESYLDPARILAAARVSGAQAIHPGYGFLSERATFAAAVETAGLVFIGPTSRTIAAIGDKLSARRIAQAAGVPVVPGSPEVSLTGGPRATDAIVASAEEIGYPLLVKAAAGGGGRGMRRVERPDDLAAALAASAAEAAAAFGDGAVYLEREIRGARHIEVQLLGEAGGLVIAIGERDCSIQRRHQKLIEEAPAIGLSASQRLHVHELAVRVGSAAGLRNAATVEFLYDPDGRFWFLEVNARLQVEHAVTELVSGLDLVQEQIWLAAGAPLSAAARAAADRAASPIGHAIEVRISLEDPARDFLPTIGRIGQFTMAAGPGVRIDTAIEAGERVPAEYDPLIAKLIVHGTDRPAAIERLRRALDETEISGSQTTLPFHRFVAGNSAFRAGNLSTSFVDEHWNGPAARAAAVRKALVAAGLAALQPGPVPSSAAEAAGRLAAGSGSPGAPSVRSSWRLAGRNQAVDRWPR